MNWAIFWICICVTAILLPGNAHGHGEAQNQASTHSASLPSCKEKEPLTRLYMHRSTHAWNSYLRVDDDWRAQCRSLYTQCKNHNWGFEKGWNCHECFRNCEGQQQWPFHLCGPSIKKTKPKPPPKRRRR
jgi:hypothetical protein